MAAPVAAPVPAPTKREERRAAREFAKYNDERDAAVAAAITEAENKSAPTPTYYTAPTDPEGFTVAAPVAAPVPAPTKREERRAAKDFLNYNKERDAAVAAATSAASSSAEQPQPYVAPADSEEFTVKAAATDAVSAPDAREERRAAKEFVEYNKQRDAIIRATRSDDGHIHVDGMVFSPESKPVEKEAPKERAAEAEGKRYIVREEYNPTPASAEPEASKVRAVDPAEEDETAPLPIDPEIARGEALIAREAELNDMLEFARYSEERDDEIALAEEEEIKLDLPYVAPKDEDDVTPAAAEPDKIPGEQSFIRAAVGEDAVRFSKYSRTRERELALQKENEERTLDYTPTYEAPEDTDTPEALSRRLTLMYPDYNPTEYEGNAAAVAEREYRLVRRLDEREEKRLRRKEYERIIREDESSKRAKARLERRSKGRSVTSAHLDSIIGNKSSLTKLLKSIYERDMRYIRIKTVAQIVELETAWVENKYSLVNTAADKRLTREFKRDIKEAKRNRPEAIKLERADNERYRSFAAEDVAAAGYTGGQDTEEISKLRRRLLELLIERDEINVKLIELYYAGSKKNIAIKEAKVEKARKKELKRQKKLKYLLGRRGVGSTYYNRLIDLMDQQIDLAGDIAKHTCTLKSEKPTGRKRRETRKALRRAKLVYDRNKYEIKRTKKIAFREAFDRKIRNRDLILSLILLLGIAVGGFFLWQNWDAALEWVKQTLPALSGILPLE